MKVEGGCHCGLVRYEATVADGLIEVHDCNCSVCTMTGYQHVIVPEDDFRLLEGKGDLTTYRFGTGSARHMFCNQCGIKSFYRPRSHPKAYSLNLRCIDDADMLDTVIVRFDGRDHPGAIG